MDEILHHLRNQQKNAKKQWFRILSIHSMSPPPLLIRPSRPRRLGGVDACLGGCCDARVVHGVGRDVRELPVRLGVLLSVGWRVWAVGGVGRGRWLIHSYAFSIHISDGCGAGEGEGVRLLRVGPRVWRVGGLELGVGVWALGGSAQRRAPERGKKRALFCETKAAFLARTKMRKASWPFSGWWPSRSHRGQNRAWR